MYVCSICVQSGYLDRAGEPRQPDARLQSKPFKPFTLPLYLSLARILYSVYLCLFYISSLYFYYSLYFFLLFSLLLFSSSHATHI